MSIGQTSQIASSNSEETLALAGKIGSRLKGGEVIELVGDMGSGKTTFVKGLARGAGSVDHVHSPSFTIGNEYKAKTLTLYHFDLHRLNEPGLIRDELAEVISAPESVVVIEWASIIKDVLPVEHLTIKFIPIDAAARQLIIECPTTLNYLIDET